MTVRYPTVGQFFTRLPRLLILKQMPFLFRLVFIVTRRDKTSRGEKYLSVMARKKNSFSIPSNIISERVRLEQRKKCNRIIIHLSCCFERSRESVATFFSIRDIETQKNLKNQLLEKFQSAPETQHAKHILS